MAQTQVHNMEWGGGEGAPAPRPGRGPPALVQPGGSRGGGAEKGGTRGLLGRAPAGLGDILQLSSSELSPQSLS